MGLSQTGGILCSRACGSLQVKMDLHLTAIPQFNPNGDPSSLGQH